MSQNHAFLFLLFPWNYNIPVEKGLKLNVHKTFRRRLLNVLCMFNLRPVSIGIIVRVMVLCSHWLLTVSKLMTKFEKQFGFKSLDDPGPGQTGNCCKIFKVCPTILGHYALNSYIILHVFTGQSERTIHNTVKYLRWSFLRK